MFHVKTQFLSSEHMTISSSANQQVFQTQKEIYLHDIKQHFLAQAVLLFEEVVFRISASDVSANQLLAWRCHLQKFRVLILDGHILGITQQLPDNRPKVVRNPFSDEILWRNNRCFFLKGFYTVLAWEEGVYIFM